MLCASAATLVQVTAHVTNVDNVTVIMPKTSPAVASPPAYFSGEMRTNFRALLEQISERIPNVGPTNGNHQRSRPKIPKIRLAIARGAGCCFVASAGEVCAGCILSAGFSAVSVAAPIAGAYSLFNLWRASSGASVPSLRSVSRDSSTKRFFSRSSFICS